MNQTVRNSVLRWTDRKNTSAGVELRFAAKNYHIRWKDMLLSRGASTKGLKVLKDDDTKTLRVKINIFEFCLLRSLLSSSGPGPGPRSGPGQVPGQVQKVQGLRTKDLDLG